MHYRFYSFIFYVIISLILLNEPVMSSWEYAVATKGQINFYGSDWKQITSAAHQFDELSALTIDETEEIVFFNDQTHNNGTIFSLKLSSDDNHRIEKIVMKTKDELIQGIAFDPLDRILYWTDARNKLIYQFSIDKKDEEPTVLLKLDDTKIPHGIAVDVCRRKLYWTNSNHRNPSIERASLDGTKYEVLINSDLFMPTGIVVDQFSKRIFWVDDREGNHYSVESANFDGTDRKFITRKLFNVPFNLAVDRENVYWTDLEQIAVWRMSKNNTETDEPEKILNFTTTPPKGIVVRSHFLSTQTKNPECYAVLNKIRSVLLAPTDANLVKNHPVTLTTPAAPVNLCLNEGYLNPKSNLCICPREFKGIHCEIPICHNYCLEGTCHISTTGYAQCTCHAGFSGDRCERDVCAEFCLNGGRCNLENDEPVCHCLPSYYGRRCELMDMQSVCERFCNEEEVDIKNMDLPSICGNCSHNKTLSYYTLPGLANSEESSYPGSSRNNHHRNVCSNETVVNKTAVFVSIGVVVSLVLVFIIINSIRHVYKPLRPRIKKTYVVHKNVIPTPLTCRPTTEQCEITIENCCNMNICDTPCFDPKTIQQEIARKEDKKTLLNHPEGDLMY